MLFNSYVFLCGFLPVVLGGFCLACRFGRMAAMGWLLLASLGFYSWWSLAFPPVLLASIGANFCAARLILAAGGRARQCATISAILANLAALGWYKYLPAVLLAAGAPPPATPELPLGISFFTFTQIGYLLDCHAGLERRRPLLDYALFVTFFPHLIAGPILSAREILPAFADPASWRPSARNLAVGGGIFLIGLLKKTLLADPVATLVPPGFMGSETLQMLPAWRAALAWSMQLYFDFSGYSDMAVGLARMFGIAFPANFDSPYKAASVIAYWQRWHISLTRFLMSTVHAPLTMAIMRRRRAQGRAARGTIEAFGMTVAAPIFITMTLAGIWHGAGLPYLIFGVLHAAFLTVNHAWRRWGPSMAETTWTVHVASVSLTYLCVLVGAVIFRAPSLNIAGTLLAAMLGMHGLGFAMEGRGCLDLFWLGGLGFIVWGAPNSTEIMTASARGALAWRPTIPWAAAFGAAATLGLLSVGGASEFLYFQF